MSEPALRLLDRGLPRLENVFNPAFLRRMKAKRRGIVLPLPEPVAATEKAKPINHIQEYRREIERRAAAIYAQTRALTFNPDDRGRSVSAILADVARQHGVSAEEIRGENRFKLPVAARHQVIVRVYLAYPKLPFTALGRAVGGRDHSTVISALVKAGHYRRRQGTTGEAA